MSICFDEAKGLLTLETLSTSYQMKIDRAGYLEHLYYGARIDGADMSYQLRHYDRGFSGNPYAERHDRTFSLDTLGQEYSSFGVGLTPQFRFFANRRCSLVIGADFIFDFVMKLKQKTEVNGNTTTFNIEPKNVFRFRALPYIGLGINFGN